jgi:hypothetical protein
VGENIWVMLSSRHSNLSEAVAFQLRNKPHSLALLRRRTWI